VFTVDHPEDIKKMRELGVDGVFTNYPERVLKKNTVNDTVGWP
jgi:glycerophosphoryl diester phosphodiesterase